MRANALLLTLAAWAASTSCISQATKEHKPGIDAPAYTLNIWIQPDPRLPREAVMKGCSQWKAERITCVAVDAPEKARVRIYANDDACHVQDKKDVTVWHTYLAWAHQGGDIKMMMGCMPHKDGAYDPHYFAGVVTHEVGHEIGIWEHVPDVCDDKDTKTPNPDIKTHAKSGKKICGQAVMNEYYHDAIDYVTEIDAMAFDERELDVSVLVGDIPRKSTPGCVYELPPQH